MCYMRECICAVLAPQIVRYYHCLCVCVPVCCLCVCRGQSLPTRIWMNLYVVLLNFVCFSSANTHTHRLGHMCVSGCLACVWHNKDWTHVKHWPYVIWSVCVYNKRSAISLYNYVYHTRVIPTHAQTQTTALLADTERQASTTHLLYRIKCICSILYSGRAFIRIYFFGPESLMTSSSSSSTVSSIPHATVCLPINAIFFFVFMVWWYVFASCFELICRVAFVAFGWYCVYCVYALVI